MTEYLSPNGSIITVDTAVLRTSPSPSEGSSVSEGSTFAEETQRIEAFSSKEELDTQAYFRNWKSRSPRSAPSAAKKALLPSKPGSDRKDPPKSPSPAPSKASSDKSSSIKPTAGPKPAKDGKGK